MEQVNWWDQIQHNKSLFEKINSPLLREQMLSSSPLLNNFFHMKLLSHTAKSFLIVDAFGLSCVLHLSLCFCFSVSFSHSTAEEAEATVQGECRGQEAQAAESPERGM